MKEGDLFVVPYASFDSPSEVTPFFVNSHITSVEAPLGRWKDGLFDCLRYGPAHPSFLNCFFCPQILMAQVLTRFKMNWIGNPTSHWRGTFGRVVVIVSVYWIVTILLAPPAAKWVFNEETGKSEFVAGESLPPFQAALYNIVTWSFGFYTLIVLTRLRRKVRIRFEIPPTSECFGGGECEDCCISFWCAPCSVAQIARQTCDYEHQSAACCSPTGLGASPRILPDAPVLTV